MLDLLKINELIEQGYENEFLDFKATAYSEKGAQALLKDVLSMANSNFSGEKYIILGVKDDLLSERKIVGIRKEDIVDPANFQQIILNNIEPDIDINVFYIKYHGQDIGVIKLSNTNQKPYMMKKKNGQLTEGLCLIRKGSQCNIAKRSDFDQFYLNSQNFKIRIMDGMLRAVNDKEGIAYLEVVISNLTTNPVTIIGGTLNVSKNKSVLTQHRVFGFEKNLVGADFRMELPPKTEKVGDLHLGFSSTDCLRLKLDKFGYTEENYNLELTLYDSMNNPYQNKYEEGTVFAKGKFLWKVQL